VTGQEKIQRGYTVSVRQVGTPDSFHVSYAPRGLRQARGAGGTPKRVPPGFKALVQGEQCAVSWINPPKDPEASQEDFEKDAAARVKLLRKWLGLLTPLMESIQGWADELGWSHRRVEKPMKDEDIGDYRVPALLLQEDTVRVAVDPIGRSAPGTEGVVDFYLMPAYDDIASLYYYGGRWNLHSMPEGSPAVATIREAASKPLSKKAVREVLDGMKNAG
jgi:hypothetical protein